MNSFKDWLIIKVKHLKIIGYKKVCERQEQERLSKEKLEKERLENEKAYPERYPHKFLKERKITNYSELIEYFITIHNMDTEYLTQILKQPMELEFNSKYLEESKLVNRTLLSVARMHKDIPRINLDVPYDLTYSDFLNELLFFVSNDQNLMGTGIRENLINKYLFKPDKLLDQIIQHEKRLDTEIYNHIPISVGDYGYRWGVNDGNHRICMARFFNYKYLLTR